MSQYQPHVIPLESARTIDGLFRERAGRTPDLIACRHFNEQHGNWRDYTWGQIDHQVARWQAALESDGLRPGDRVAVMLRNSPEWVIFDQAALGLGLVVVPLYTQDRPDNVAYIVNDAGCKVLLFERLEQWHSL
jgi:long-chain acyl-CoA synthetase